ncbi:MAG: 1-acyl-sn-glycerol-3-phosphate acyltransferase [Oligoflexales bacterium]|nr:1-acyl-sn-glycerol-3-phosphate acyltransferase [Oligoflexales bacterium]
MLFLFLCAGNIWNFFFNPKYINDFSHKIATIWGKSVLYFTPGWSFSMEGRCYLPKEGEKAAVVVGNHQSAVDICVMLAANFPFRWLSKSDVFKVPIVGWGMKLAGYVPVERGNKRSQKKALEDSAEWIRKNVSMVFFPEGSRSETGDVGNFKSGAFRLAIGTDVPIIPVAIIGSRNLMKKNSIIPTKASVHLKILPPTKQKEGETLEKFINRIRESISYEITSCNNCPQLLEDKTINQANVISSY